MKNFSSLKSKLIYVFRINDENHKGCLKIGEATCEEGDISELRPNSKQLNQAAKKRINQYTQTAGVAYELLYTELTIFMQNGQLCSFNDKEVHSVLERSGIKKKLFDQVNKANEWFITDLETVKKAISAIKAGRSSLLAHEITHNQSPIVFRPEQHLAIENTKKQFRKGDRMLWNAKMRFGKTLSALQVVKDMEFQRTLILTHRPVVNEGWFEDFNKIFYDRADFAYGSKDRGESFDNLEQRVREPGQHYVYFASLQDLRGSEVVGGDFDKNDEIFSAPWSLIIIDEAHEGTQTELADKVLKALKKGNTKLLSLSGTPFNLLHDYKQGEIYTWDYIMEQRAKQDWDKTHFGDPNPYAALPKLNILTYNLGKLLNKFEDETIAFNFREFFRVNESGSFVHNSDVVAFLNLLTKEDKDSKYPFANEEYRNIFRHTLWIVPGVKEAKALSSELQKHAVFQFFNVINVAGDGDEEEGSKDALKSVKSAIGPNPEETRTITISCGRLTTGVSVPAWMGVFMLSGSYNTSASSYMQTIFRVQTPATINGKVKENCYVFDFAPDRTLKVLAETAKISAQAGKTTDNDRQIIGDFLNFCPVISIDGSRMYELDVSHMLEQLKKVYVERVVRNGFEDNRLYNDELLKLSDLDLKAFDKLKGIIGQTKAMPKTNEIEINNQGLTEEEYEEKEKLDDKSRKKKLTEEEKQRLDELKKKTKNRENAISILRGISVRMPLMIYGAELRDEKEDITIDNFAKIVDEKSWHEFMPNGVEKDLFEHFKKFYDKDIFRAAGRRIRELVRAADKLPVEERIERVTSIFATFRNPDKETVLTPWRVVNLHMAETLGGYSFYDSKYQEPQREPHFVDRGKVSGDVFKSNTKLLEINSKSGLYPLYLAYSLYRNRLSEIAGHENSIEHQQALWDKVISENIFVICKTPMAKKITERTLVGFRNVKVNTRYFEELINQVKNKNQNFIKKVQSHFNMDSDGAVMNFNAIVGNPPYQMVVAKKDSTNGQKVTVNIFQYFQLVSEQLGNYTSLIYPGARWIHYSGKGLKEFGREQMNDPHLALLEYFPDSSDIFPDVDIAGGVSIVLKDMGKSSTGFEYRYCKNGEIISIEGKNPGLGTFSLDPSDSEISSCLEKAIAKFACLHDSVLPRTLFGIESNFVESNPELVKEFDIQAFDPDTEVKLFANDKAGKGGKSHWYIVKRSAITSGLEYLNQWKVIVSSANAGGIKRANQIELIDNHSVFGRQRVALKTFKTQKEAQNFFKYATSEVIRYAFLLTDEALNSLAKKVPDLLDYSDQNTLIDYSKDVDSQLYKLFGIGELSRHYIHEKLSNRGR